MNCPVCKTTALRLLQLDNQLPTHTCETCEGIWLALSDYLAWQKRRAPQPPAEPPAEVTVTDIQQAKLCPACGHILRKYRVGRGVTFALDRCETCSGIWFDRHEWEALKGRHLLVEINSIFTAPWQAQVHAEEHRAALEAIYTRKLGRVDYAELRRIREWINNHPQRALLLAYLNSDDPYR